MKMIISLFTTFILHSNAAEIKLNMNTVLTEKSAQNHTSIPLRDLILEREVRRSNGPVVDIVSVIHRCLHIGQPHFQGSVGTKIA
jgi:hypothetical protein